MSDRSSGRIDPGDSDHGGYWRVSKRPLQVLIFLLPLILLYEFGMLFVLQTDSGATQTNKAHKTLIEFFDVVGIHASGWYLPGIVMIVVLIVWQALSREPWKVRPRALLVMLLESVAFTLPLIIMSMMLSRLGVGPEPAAGIALAPAGFRDLTLLERLMMSVGAGLYEELVFRMLLLGAIHALMVDIIKSREWFGTTLAIVLSALAFSIYHFDPGALADTFSWGLALFYLVAGIFLGLLFIARGFGIVVAVHALYDVVTAILQ